MKSYYSLLKWPGLLMLVLMWAAPQTWAQADTKAGATNRTLVVATKEAPPFAMEGADGSWSGLSIELWELVAEELDLEFDYEKMSLGDLLKKTEAGQVDLGVSAITITPEREAKMDFSHAYYSAGLGLAYKSQRHSLFIMILRNIFSWQFLSAIIALGLVLLVAGAAVWIFERKSNRDQFGGKPLEGLGSGFWWSAVTMTTVGYGDKAPQTPAGRVVALIWMFASIIIISSFTAAIASSVTVDRLDTQLLKSRSLQELHFGVVTQSTGEAHAKSKGYRHTTYSKLSEALDALGGQEIDAVVYDLPLLQYEALTHPERGLDVLSKPLVPEQYAFVMPTNSPMRERLNVALVRFIREPEWERIKQRHLGK